MQKFDPIIISDESTVIAEYVSEHRTATGHESEAQLEKSFVDLLKGQAYQYLNITTDTDLISNLRSELQKLNYFTFSDTEWERFFTQKIASANDGALEKTIRIQEDWVQTLIKDDGTSQNIKLIDKENINNNSLQVINQYEAAGRFDNRYDVTILVNGLPMVHIELKRRGVDIREAFNQINRYKRDSFWAGSGLFEYVQLFVISNGTYTKYYSNTVRESQVQAANGDAKRRKTSNSFEFTSWWADANNKRIEDLMAFGKTFFAKHTILNVLTKYSVLTVDRTLLVMRPYQIVATERILRRILTSGNAKTTGSVAAGGYVWHTTGSGKTLTSFKTAILASRMTEVSKVLFVVDRKDLDYQTMKEYDRFQKGAANASNSTRHLQEHMEDPNSRIVITTIQKLSRFIASNKGHEVTNKRVVIIFDECHRSQFGAMHTEIRKAFKNYHLFGFTGTPIFAANAAAGARPDLQTTEQVFGEKLHTYTIVDAIADKNVLPFRVDYVNTFRVPENLRDKKVAAIDTEAALLAPERIKQVTEYILEHFNQKTRRNDAYELERRRVSGFNSILATQSIQAAKAYYLAFKQAQAELPANQRLKIATIFSFAPNDAEDYGEGMLDDEQFEVDQLDVPSREFLEGAITDYNAMFGTNFSTRADDEEGFSSYYKSIAGKLKNRDLDLVIVVNMFLTGFDATTLNTLWVDKNLRQHGLLQAFSRTNRILNSIKTFGNIVCFRDLEQATKDAITMFGNKDAAGIVILAPYSDYISQYEKVVEELRTTFPTTEIPISEKAQKDFVVLFNEVLKLLNVLVVFDEFEGNDLLSTAQLADYKSMYLEIRHELVRQAAEKEDIVADLVFEVELIKSVDINVDFILELVRKLQAAGDDQNKDREIKAEINRAVNSSIELRSKKDLIEQFISRMNNESDVGEAWSEFISEQRSQELEQIIDEENLDPAAARVFVDQAFRSGSIQAVGTGLARVMPARNMFSPAGEAGEQRERVLSKLHAFFERFFTL
jgi:type I restriction enzyme R subunit